MADDWWLMTDDSRLMTDDSWLMADNWWLMTDAIDADTAASATNANYIANADTAVTHSSNSQEWHTSERTIVAWMVILDIVLNHWKFSFGLILWGFNRVVFHLVWSSPGGLLASSLDPPSTHHWLLPLHDDTATQQKSLRRGSTTYLCVLGGCVPVQSLSYLCLNKC